MASSTVACSRWNRSASTARQSEVGDECVVTPVGPELSLPPTSELGAANDQADPTLSPFGLAPAGHVDGLGHLGGTAVGIGDVDPRILADRCDGCLHAGVLLHGDRPGDRESVEDAHQVPAEEPRVGSQHHGPGPSGPAHPGDELFDEALGAPLRRTLAQSGMEDLTGGRPHGEQRVVAEDLGVAIGRALLRLAVHLDDGRIQVDRHRVRTRTRPERPGPPDRLGDHLVELADVAEGEGPQERAERGGRHDPERQNPPCRPGTQAIRVVDVARPGEDRRDQGQHLASRTCSTRPARQSERSVHQGLEAQADHQGGRHHDQPGIGHQRRLVEGHAIRSVVREDELTGSASSVLVRLRRLQAPPFSQAGRHFPRMRGPQITKSIGGSRLSHGTGPPSPLMSQDIVDSCIRTSETAGT